ncbi:MAG TPA: OmpA family protein, partial [Paracoccaceae bacterium]|nr:OmpA family protein [Paracoccaceae bacterium]
GPAAPTPDWPAALALALRAATALPRAQVSLGPCRLEVSGVAPDGGTRAALLDALRAAGPCLAAAEILAPKPLVSPYRFDLGLADGVPVLAACAVPTPNGRARILEAVRALGPAADAACAEASGAPSERWTEAVLAAVRALGQLGAGRVRITDSDVRLEPSPGLAGPLRLRAAERLAAALPPGFALAPPKTGPGEAGLSPDAPLAPALFIARRRADGLVKLIGTLPADSAAQAVSSYAAALFGTGMVAGHMGADPSLPDGWIRRVMAGLDALALLAEGELRIEETFVALSGRTLAADAEAEARRLLGRAFGPDDDLRLAIRYDAAAAEAARAPRPDECLADMLAELSERQIQFPPGSSAIAEESRAMLDRLAEIIRACAPARFEIGGHTDTSGPADGNLALSQARADSVVDALLARGVDLDRMAAKGYGEAEPIADNSTEAGRALNRRIGLKLLFPADGPH